MHKIILCSKFIGNLSRISIYCILLFSFSSHSFSGENIKYLKVYYKDWNSMTKGSLSVEDVRNNPDVYMDIKNIRFINGFLSYEKKLKCKEYSGKIGDIRMVVELYDGIINKEYYFSNRDLAYFGKSICTSEVPISKFFNMF